MTQSPSASQPAPEQEERSGWVRRVAVGGIWVVGGGIVLILLLLSPAGATGVARILAGSFAPEGTSLDIGRVSGWLPFSATLRDVRMRDGAGNVILEADRVEVDPVVSALLRGRLRFRTVQLRGWSLLFRDRPQGQWGLGLAGSAESPPATTTSDSAPGLWIGRLTSTGGSVFVLAQGTPSDTTVQVRDIAGRALEVRSVSGGFAATIPDLGGVLGLAVAQPGYRMRLEASGALAAGGIAFDTLVAHGTESRVAGELALRFPDPSTSTTAISGAFGTDALAPADLQAFAPWFAGEQAVALQAQVGGTLDSVGVHLEADGHGLGTADATLAVLVGNDDGAVRWNATVQDLDPRLVMGSDALPGRLRGHSSARLSGPDPTAWDGPLSIAVARSSLGEIVIDSATTRLEFTGGEGRGPIRLSVAGLSANGTGAIRPFLERPTYEARVQVSWSPGAASYNSDSGSTRLSGVLQVQGSGFEPTTLELDAHLGLGPARVGPSLRLDSLASDISLRQGRLSAPFRIGLGDGLAAARVHGVPFADEPSFTLEDGQFRNVNAASVSSGAVSTDLRGAFEGTWAGLSPQAAEASLVVDVDSSRVGDVAGLIGRIQIGLGDGAAQVDGSLDAPDSQMEFAAETRPFDSLPSWTVLPSRIAGFDAAEWTSGAAPSTDITAEFEGAGSGYSPESVQGDLSIVVGPSQFAQAAIDSAQLHLDASAGVVRGRVRGRTGRWALYGSARLDDPFGSPSAPPSYRGQFTLSEPTTLGVEESSIATLEFDGRGFDPETLALTSSVMIDSVNVLGAALSGGRARLALEDGMIRVDTLTLDGTGIRVAGAGTVPLTRSAPSGSFALEAVLTELDLVRPVVDARPLSIGRGELTLSLVGPADARQVDVSSEVNALLWGDYQLRGFWAQGQAALSPPLGSFPTTLSGSVRIEDVVTPQFTIRETTLDVGDSEDGDRIRLALTSTLDDRRTLEAQALLDPRPEARSIAIERLDASVDQDRWSLVRPSSVRYGPRFEVDSLDLRAGDQRLFVDASVAANGDQLLDATVERLELGTVADLLGFDRLQGQLSGSVGLSGTANEPAISGNFSTTLARPSGAPARATVDFRSDSSSIDVALDLEDGDGGQLRAEGMVPVALQLPWTAPSLTATDSSLNAPVDLDIRADGLGLSWARPLIDPELVQELDGRLDMNVSVGGTAKAPSVDGSLRLGDGHWALPSLGVVWRDVGAHARFVRNEIILDSAHVRSGDDGRLSADGRVQLQALNVGAFDVRLVADDFQAIDNELATATITGQAQIGGTTSQPDLTGDLRLLSTDVYLGGFDFGNGAVEDVTLSDSDYEHLAETFGRSFRSTSSDPIVALDSLAVDLNITAGRDIWVRQSGNPELALQMTGDLRVEKARGDSLSLTGTVEGIPERSYVKQFGKRFALRTAELDFRGAPLETQVDVEAIYSVPSIRDPDQAEVTVTLGIQGTLEQLGVTLGSEPSMDASDIVSYLATGRPASRDLALPSNEASDGESLTQTGTDLALSTLAGSLESAAAQGIGLDVVEIELDGLRGATLVAGRYISPRLFVGFRRPLSLSSSEETTGAVQPPSEVELEYQALRWLLLNLEVGGGAFDFLIRSRVAY